MLVRRLQNAYGRFEIEGRVLPEKELGSKELERHEHPMVRLAGDEQLKGKLSRVGQRILPSPFRASLPEATGS